MDSLTTVTYDQIAIGDSATYTRTVTERDVVLFSEVSGDHNPLHLDEGYASGTAFGERIAHGMRSGAFISACVAMKMLGPGTVYLGQTMKFLRPVKLGDTVTVTMIVAEKDDRRNKATLDCKVTNQNGKAVVTGTSEVMVATEAASAAIPALPEITVAGLDR